MSKKPTVSECDLCAIFIGAVRKQGAWTALPDYLGYHCGMIGPDYRGVLIPRGVNADLAPLCRALGIEVFVARVEDYPRGVFSEVFWPALPSADGWPEVNGDWHGWCPNQRCRIPDYVPDVAARRSAPLQLTEWKVRAIKLAIILEERPAARADFNALKLHPQRWLDPSTKWLVATEEGYVVGPGMPKLRQEHPTNYEQIKADKEKWMSAPVRLARQLSLAVEGA